MLILLVLPAAFAMANFPTVVEEELGMPCAATCDLCHSSTAGGGTPTTPFGLAMMDRGLTMSSDSSAIADALAQMEQDAVDSDDDGTIDTEELVLGMNPNGDTDFCADGQMGPSYGCASVRARPGGLLLPLLGLLALGRRRQS